MIILHYLWHGTVFIKSKLHIFNFLGLIQFYDKKKTHLKKWKKNWPMRGQVTRVLWGSPWSLCVLSSRNGRIESFTQGFISCLVKKCQIHYTFDFLPIKTIRYKVEGKKG